MARGRMLNRSLAHSVQFSNLQNDTHRLLFVMAIPHLDRDGRMTGNPRAFRATACPMLDHVTDETVRAAFSDFERVKLVQFYTDDEGQEVASAPGFERQQQGMRYGREGPSRFGPDPNAPPKGKSPRGGRGNSGAGPDDSGLGPDNVRNLSNSAESHNSGVTPDQVRTSSGERRLKGNEVKGKLNGSASVSEKPHSLTSNLDPRAHARAQGLLRNAIPEEERERELDFQAPEPTRIDPNWKPSESLYRWAAEDRDVDLPPDVVSYLGRKFVDYWKAQGGPRSMRADWDAQFRNYGRMYREDHPKCPRASQNDRVEVSKLPPPKHPGLAKIESEIAGKGEVIESSELMASLSRVGVLDSEG